MKGSMPGSFTPGEALSLKGGTEDSWPVENIEGGRSNYNSGKTQTKKQNESCSSNVMCYADIHTSNEIVQYFCTVLPGGVGACGGSGVGRIEDCCCL